MSTSFSSTLRVLQNDPQTVSLGWTAAVCLLLLGWLGWFLFAPFPRSVEGSIVSADGAGIVLAQLPSAAANQLHIGQSIEILSLQDGQPQQPDTPAIVSDIQLQTNDSALVEFYIDLDTPSAAAFDAGSTGRVRVVVEQLSPAQLIWRATGQTIDTPPVQVE